MNVKVAIPIWGSRISPLFDTAQRLLVVEIVDGKVENRKYENINEDFPPRRIRHLVEIGVNVLICDGISSSLALMASAAGVVVIPWISGEVDEVIQAYLKNKLPGQESYMSGYCKRRYRFRLRHGISKNATIGATKRFKNNNHRKSKID